MKKYVIYIVVTLSLLIAAAALYYFRFVPKEQGFAVKEIGKVTKIVMKNTKQQQIVLSRQGDKWFVNLTIGADGGEIGREASQKEAWDDQVDRVWDREEIG